MEDSIREFPNKKKWELKKSLVKQNRISKAYPSTKPEKVYYYLFLSIRFFFFPILIFTDTNKFSIFILFFKNYLIIYFFIHIYNK